MLTDILFGLGFVAIVEGLVLALAPSRLAQLLDMLREIGPERTRVLGLVIVAGGVLLVWAVHGRLNVYVTRKRVIYPEIVTGY